MTEDKNCCAAVILLMSSTGPHHMLLLLSPPNLRSLCDSGCHFRSKLSYLPVLQSYTVNYKIKIKSPQTGALNRIDIALNNWDPLVDHNIFRKMAKESQKLLTHSIYGSLDEPTRRKQLTDFLSKSFRTFEAIGEAHQSFLAANV